MSSPEAANLETPKSRIFTKSTRVGSWAWPWARKTLAGLRSRWTMSAAWAAPSPSRSWRTTRAASAGWRRPSARTLLERLALEQLHHQEAGAALELAHVEDLDDVGRSNPPGGLRFALEAAQGIVPLGHVGVQHLDGHAPADEHVLGLVNGAHGSVAELAHDAVPSGVNLSVREEHGGAQATEGVATYQHAPLSASRGALHLPGPALGTGESDAWTSASAAYLCSPPS